MNSHASVRQDHLAPGQVFCFGTDSRWLEWPIANLPPGVVQVKRRVARAIVVTPGRVEHWLLRLGTLVLDYLQGANVLTDLNKERATRLDLEGRLNLKSGIFGEGGEPK